MRALFLFAIMCLLWGATWYPIKVAAEIAGPFWMGSVRFLIAGGLILLFLYLKEKRLPAVPGWPRFVVGALILYGFLYLGLFWSSTRLPSAVSALVHFAMLPVGYMIFGSLIEKEKLSYRHFVGLLLGFVGVSMLFVPNIEGDIGTLDVIGVVVVLVTTLTMGLGAVMVRPVMQSIPVYAAAGYGLLIGGSFLLVFAVAEKADGWYDIVVSLERPDFLLSFIYLVFFASMGALGIYLLLLRDWGSVRSSLYAYVSPLIALMISVFITDETVVPVQIAAAIPMLLGAAFSSNVPWGRLLRGKSLSPAKPVSD
ncbi:DMT family transporter [Kiloniella sp. b19]|uniref:DMT family transporter n=1 Tax=Kiloniella sp. GXU_MW_B19 TaxID=3141326 RepID=UPI0031CEF0A4